MIEGQNALVQTLLGTLLTWGLTAAGAAVVVVIHGRQRKLLDASLGFAGGVMIAASYWSLLAPAIQLAEESQMYGEKGEYAFIPVGIGFFLGGLFVYLTDVLISSFGLCAPHLMLVMEDDVKRIRKKDDALNEDRLASTPSMSRVITLDEMHGRRRTLTNNHNSNSAFYVISNSEPISLHQSRSANSIGQHSTPNLSVDNYGERKNSLDMRRPSSAISNDSTHSSLLDQWKRIVLLIVAITLIGYVPAYNAA